MTAAARRTTTMEADTRDFMTGLLIGKSVLAKLFLVIQIWKVI
jgi:hypothetical protein